MIFPTRRRRSSLEAAPLQAAGGGRVRVWASDFGASLGAALLALALLLAAAPAAGRQGEASGAAAGHALVDGGAPALHARSVGQSSIAPHAPRRPWGDGVAPSIARSRMALSSRGARLARLPRTAQAPHSVLAAGFDATAPPA